MNSEKSISKHLQYGPITLMLYMISFLQIHAAPDDIDITVANPVHTYTILANQAFNEQIAVLNATAGNVFWEFFSTPVAGTPSSFTHMGITVTLPAGAPDNSVGSGQTVTVSGTPTTTGSFAFTLTVTEDGGGSLTQNRQFEIIITQSMDLVLVFDRSGSMTTATTAGVSRWDALKSAAGNFANLYQSLNRLDDRLSITYFETDLTPASACCNTLIPFAADIGTDVTNDLDANTPAGWTAMGAGMKNAQGKLTDATRARAILLFTDGEQNQNPMVNANGQGYSDGTNIPGGNSPGGLKVSTIGIGNPSPMYNTTLQNLALNNRGSYYITTNGTAFTFQAGADAGDMSSGFTNQFVDILAEFSPQLVTRSTTNVGQGSPPHALLSFQLNKRVDKLLLEISFDQNFESPQLAQLLGRIMVQKDGTSMMDRIQPSWAGNFPNTILLKIDFVNPRRAQSPIDPAGNWTVQLANVVEFKINQCRVTALADDHRLNYEFSIGSVPMVNTPLQLTANLDWLGYPISDADVEAIILKPGQDLGNFLAKNPLTVDVSSTQDAGSPGVQKFEQLWASNEEFRNALALSENLVTLNHTENGHYEGTFNALTVSGLYKVIYRISGSHTDGGNFQRMKVESFYTSFNGIDLNASQASAQMLNDQLVMQIRPVALNGLFIGPAAGSAFTVDQPGVQIGNIEDHQDGRYTITFSGDVSQAVTLSLLGQEVYTGKLADIGKGGSGAGIIEKIQEWLISIGLPAWSVWLLLLLILILLMLWFRRKKSS